MNAQKPEKDHDKNAEDTEGDEAQEGEDVLRQLLVQNLLDMEQTAATTHTVNAHSVFRMKSTVHKAVLQYKAILQTLHQFDARCKSGDHINKRSPDVCGL